MYLAIFELPGAEFALRRCLKVRRGVDLRDMRASGVRFVIAFTTPDGSFCTTGADSDEVTGKESALIVALYQGKMTYGEFAQKRYEFARDGIAAEREFRQATLIGDQQRAVQAQQLAQQNFQNRLAVWSAYIQAVNSRPPQTNIHVEQNVTVR